VLALTGCRILSYWVLALASMVMGLCGDQFMVSRYWLIPPRTPFLGVGYEVR